MSTKLANMCSRCWLFVVDLVRAAVELPFLGLGVALYHARLAPLVIGLRRDSPRVLMFHALEEKEGPFILGLSINTRPTAFAAQLDFLLRHYHIVAMPAYGTKPLLPRALFITFDDGFRSVYQHAFPVLKAAAAPATCYVCTDVIGNRALIWLNEIIWFLHQHPLRAEPIVAAWLLISGNPARRPLVKGLIAHDDTLKVAFRSAKVRRALVKGLIAQYDRARIRDLVDTLRASTGVAPDDLAREASLYLNPVEIEEMAHAGITFGNHSGSHAVLPRLSEEDCRNELARAQNALDSMPGSIPSLAFPFGRANETTRRIAIELGYTTLLEVEGLNNPVDPLRVGRLNVTSDSPAVLFARMEIVAPIKWRLKQFLTRWRSPR